VEAVKRDVPSYFTAVTVEACAAIVVVSSGEVSRKAPAVVPQLLLKKAPDRSMAETFSSDRAGRTQVSDAQDSSLGGSWRSSPLRMAQYLMPSSTFEDLIKRREVRKEYDD